MSEKNTFIGIFEPVSEAEVLCRMRKYLKFHGIPIKRSSKDTIKCKYCSAIYIYEYHARPPCVDSATTAFVDSNTLNYCGRTVQDVKAILKKYFRRPVPASI